MPNGQMGGAIAESAAAAADLTVGGSPPIEGDTGPTPTATAAGRSQGQAIIVRTSHRLAGKSQASGQPQVRQNLAVLLLFSTTSIPENLRMY